MIIKQFSEGYPCPTEGYRLENQVGNNNKGSIIKLEVPLLYYDVQQDKLKTFIDLYSWKIMGVSERSALSFWPFRRKVVNRSRTYNLWEGKIYVDIHNPSEDKLKKVILDNVGNPDILDLEELINPLIKPLEEIQEELQIRKREDFRRLNFAHQMS